MIEAKDICISSGENKASEDEELNFSLSFGKKVKLSFDVPHSHIVLHHEFVYSFSRMRHVNFALPVAKIRLQKLY